MFRVHGREDGILRPATVGHGRKASRASLAGWASGVGLVCIVAAFTFATRAHELPLTPFVASAAKIASGQVWVVPASALIVDRPVLIGLAAFGVLAVATLRFCGARTFWLAAALGHAGSTLLVYAIIGSTRLADPDTFTTRGREPGFRRFGDARRLGWRDRSDSVESGRHRSPRPGPRRRRRLRGRWSRVVASPRPLHPHHRAPVRVLHRLRHRVVAAAGCCGEDGGKPSPRSRAPGSGPARLTNDRAPVQRGRARGTGRAVTVELDQREGMPRPRTSIWEPTPFPDTVFEIPTRMREPDH